MSTEINIKKAKKTKEQLHAEIKEKCGNPGRNPDKALEDMYGLWEGRDINIEKIREKNLKRKWLG